jgi:hypothetical protein
VAYRAACALGGLKVEKAVDALVPLLSVRLKESPSGLNPADGAMEALERIGTPKALSAIEAFKKQNGVRR